MKDGTSYGIGAEEGLHDWELLDWLTIGNMIKKLRRRIFRATCEQKWNRARSLMKLMLRSYFNLLLSVRRVTEINRGKRTAGIDKQRALTPKSRMALVIKMTKQTLWKAKPTRRLNIPKAGQPGQFRPLSIPTIANRVAQTIVKNALEPSWEARFETNSYGFRPGRSIHDAIGNTKRPWVLDADIKSAFDKTSHDCILKTIGPVPGHEFLKQTLKAGYVEAEIFHDTESGTAQGGNISPVLFNVALNGLQQELGPEYGYVRYADDLIVTAGSREQIEAIIPTIQEWLSERGLALHSEKTRIVNANEGFNFLGFSIRRYKGKCLIKPQKERVLAFLLSIRRWLSKHPQVTAEVVIRHLNPKLQGWCQNYKHVVSKQVFSYVGYRLWQMIWRWCLRRHSGDNKGKRWVRQKYFGDDWKFQTRCRTEDGETTTIFLFDPQSVRIERHVKVRSTASPNNPALKDYWQERTIEKKVRQLTSRRKPALSGALGGLS